MTKEQRDKKYNEIKASKKELQKRIEGLDIDKDREEMLNLVFKEKALVDELTKLVMVKLRVDLKEDILKNVVY